MVKAFAEWLKENSQQYLIGEHPADDQVKTTHCHILVEGLKVTRESLRKQIIKYSPGRGQYFTSALTQETREPYERNHLARYIIKGNVQHVKATSFDEIQIAIWASQWINYKDLLSVVQVPVGTAPKKKASTIYDDCNAIADRLTWVKDPGQLPRIEERTDVVDEIIKWANENRKALHSQQVGNYYDVVLQNAVPEYYKKVCVDRINRRHAFGK